MNSLGHIGKPTSADDYNVYDGLTRAVKELSIPSDFQSKRISANDDDEAIENKGRIICITHARR